MNNSEQIRLQTLYDYKILDTSVDKFFEDLTRLASIICNTEIAGVNFIDKDRIWFKSKLGMNGVSHEIERYNSFCQYMLSQSDFCEVNNSLKNELLKNNPFVIGPPYIRFYAAVPLIAPNNSIIGSVFVIGKSSQNLSLDQMEGLKIISNQILCYLELRKKQIKE